MPLPTLKIYQNHSRLAATQQCRPLGSASKKRRNWMTCALHRPVAGESTRLGVPRKGITAGDVVEAMRQREWTSTSNDGPIARQGAVDRLGPLHSPWSPNPGCCPPGSRQRFFEKKFPPRLFAQLCRPEIFSNGNVYLASVPTP